jgi:hypothetical protein
MSCRHCLLRCFPIAAALATVNQHDNALHLFEHYRVSMRCDTCSISQVTFRLASHRREDMLILGREYWRCCQKAVLVRK